MNDEATVATLKTRMEMLTESISRLTDSVEKNNEKLERLAVLEVSHNNSNAAIDRAFNSIKDLQNALEVHIELDVAAHGRYDRWIWVAVGFCAAVSLLWTIVGYRMNNMIDEHLQTAVEMRMHMREDKVKDAADVLKIAPGRNGNGIPQP